MDTWQEHFLSKRVEKDFKWHQDMFTPSFCKNVAQMPDWGCGAHNRGHLQSACKCHGKKKPKGFHTSEPRYHYLEKPLQFSRQQKYKSRRPRPQQYKPKRFIKWRSSQAMDKNCFLCGKPGHWASKLPKKKSKPRLAAFCDNLDSRWWDHLEEHEEPSGEYLYLPYDTDSDSPSESDVPVHPELKFSPHPPSSDSESVENLGGFQVPDFDFSLNMFNIWIFSSPARQQ